MRAKCRPLLFVIHGPLLGAVFPVRGSSIRIGRGSHVDVSLADETVLPEQVRLTVTADGAFIEAQPSHGGTFVNDARVEGRSNIADGDQLRLGRNTIIKFSMVDRIEEHALLTLFELTLRDPLTRIYNRRYFARRLHEECSFARRQRESLALLLIDIDHFKLVNDRYGHPVGDLVLEFVATSIQQQLRPEDVLARYGGEEFMVIARNTSLANAEILGERIRRHLLSLSVPLSGTQLQVTVSIGVAVMGPETGYFSSEQLVVAVDSAMYHAKSSGRNRVCSTPADAPSPNPGD
jgi:diguanylate cyclase (GGDEF)-like protein